jgi:putative ABC transport system substrate-binding protein
MLAALKEMAPSLTQVAVVRDASPGAGGGLIGAIQKAAPALGVQIVPIQQRVFQQMHDAIAIAQRNKAGLIVLPAPLPQVHRDRIMEYANRFKMPAIYPFRDYVTGGGLMSYSVDTAEVYRRAAGYVDRILKGEKPADLPVQAPQKFELAINADTAKAMGLEIPKSLRDRADEVIE